MTEPNSATLTTLEAGCGEQDVLAALDRDGACIVADLLNQTQLAQLWSEVEPLIERNAHGTDEFTGLATKRTGALVALSPAVRDAIVDDLIIGAAEQFLAPWAKRIQLHLTQVISIGAGESRQMLHTDRLAWGGYIPRPIEPQFNTIWALTDFTASNGATHIIPGSHRLDDDAWKSAELVDTVRAEMSAGSVLIYTGSVIHGGGANNTATARHGLNLTYCLSWLRTEENQFLSCPPDLVTELDLAVEITDLLGYTSANYALGYYSDPATGNLCPPEAAIGRKPSDSGLTNAVATT
ncbi:MAG: phytanoyl-CoA dioxygenase family protein [Actinobacteria bacterium]|nr:phytanoyl-CoA dioxygenase family protein [Actinomycetota bacterium]